MSARTMTASSMKQKEKDSQKPTSKLVPPDGGWGWVVVFAYALSNFIAIPIMQSFGLLFQERFVELDMSATDLSVIINVNSAFGMSLGIINGPLLNYFGYRKIAIMGALLYFFGVTATSSAGSFLHFLISYSLITSLGLFFLMSSFSLALNSYFRERRGRAVGLTSTFTGLGPVIMPQVMTLLLNVYTVQGTTLILGALSLHSLVGALLLHPIKWHMRKPIIPEEEKEEEKEEEEVGVPELSEKQGMLEEGNRKSIVITLSEEETNNKRTRTTTINSLDYEYDHNVDNHSVYGYETPLPAHRHFGSIVEIPTNEKRKTSTTALNWSISQQDAAATAKHQNPRWWESEETVNLGSSVKIFDEKPYYPLKQFHEEEPITEKKKLEDNNVSQSNIKLDVVDGAKANYNNNTISSNKSDFQSKESISKPEKKNLCSRIGHHVVNLFDLNLLRDPGYVILMLGMSLAICAEMNFSLFTPLILGDFGYTKEQIATMMSVIAIGDIVFRFLAPYIGEYLKFSAQGMYLLALGMLISSRTLLMIFNDFEPALGVAVLLGVAKGFRTVYMALVIPAYVPLERLSSASGLQMVTNSLFMVASIPIMAHVRDLTGSYSMCIGAINCITFITVMMWSTQLLRRHCCKNRTSTRL